jgi:hypothetical protein
MFHSNHFFALLIALGLSTKPALGQVQVYFNFDEWKAALISTTTIGFNDLPPFTIVENQYLDLGVTFTDANDLIVGPDDITFPNDGFALNAQFNGITAQFDSPQYGVGAHFPGTLHVEVFNDGESIFTTFNGSSGPGGPFFGLVSVQPFDSAYFFAAPFPPNQVNIDDLHFGAPARGALPVLAMLCARGRTRLRR